MRDTRDFDLENMSIGDWFLACNMCGNQYDKNTASVTTCDICGKKMHIHKVTKDDKL